MSSQVMRLALFAMASFVACGAGAARRVAGFDLEVVGDLRGFTKSRFMKSASGGPQCPLTRPHLRLGRGPQQLDVPIPGIVELVK